MNYMNSPDKRDGGISPFDTGFTQSQSRVNKIFSENRNISPLRTEDNYIIKSQKGIFSNPSNISAPHGSKIRDSPQDENKAIVDNKEKKFSEILKKLKLPLQYPEYYSRDYWDSRYMTEKGKYNDWYQSYSSLRKTLLQLLGKNYEAEILNLGCGNSKLPEELYNDGFKYITNIDFSSVIIQEMAERNKDKEQMDYIEMDISNMTIPDDCFDFIIDKGTLDCLFSSENSFELVGKALENIYRILRKEGIYFLVSHGMTDTRLDYLQNKRLDWKINLFEIKKATVSFLESVDDSQNHYIYVCSKK